MGDWLVTILVLSITIWVFWTFVQPQYVFKIRIDGGQPSLRKGRVTRAFLERVTAICQENGIVRGWIGGVRRGRRIALRFSRQFPPGSQQRLRNEWVLAD
jgi:hypothetical protein